MLYDLHVNEMYSIEHHIGRKKDKFKKFSCCSIVLKSKYIFANKRNNLAFELSTVTFNRLKKFGSFESTYFVLDLQRPTRLFLLSFDKDEHDFL